MVGAMLGNMAGPPKRKLSPQVPGISQAARFEHGPVVQRPLPTTLSEGDNDRKRRRLSSLTPDVLRSMRSEDVVLCDHLRLGDLPHEILQHIFSFVDPVSLGRLLCVNRSFHSLLDPAMSLPEGSESGKVKHLTLRSQDLIWATSRRRHLQGFPKPMDKMSELEMWRLVRGRFCQFCGKKRKSRQSLTPDPWNAGPGLDDVRTIWPFRVTSCGSCLQPRLVKESELLVSASSALRVGLPFAIFTQTLNYVPSVIIQQMDPPPLQELSKFYFRPQLEELQAEFGDVQALGPPATAEWYKGLESTGQERNTDAARFDHWELQGGLSRTSANSPIHTMIFAPSYGTDPSHKQELVPIDHAFQSWQSSPTRIHLPGSLPPGRSNHVSNSHLRAPPAPSAQIASQMLPMTPGLRRPASSESVFMQDKQESAGTTSLPSQPRQRTERTLKEVEQSKAERRREIERRCLAMNPPIRPATLPYMDAFEAATKIPRPMDDDAWAILKPRLLGQRAEAERKEQAHSAALRNPEITLEERRRLEEEHRVAQENVSHMWHELKVPSREKIQKYARDFIHQTWSDGGAVTRHTASKFAAEVLCHVRQRFFDVIAQEDRMLALKGTAFPQDPDSLACRRLKLDDMKWTFEEFVKPRTEMFGKELFLCSICETNQKLFSFEAVIQHYAAKHTSSLSRGNATVYWKAEWPAEPPFDPSPNIPWALGGGDEIPQLHVQQNPASRDWSSPMYTGLMPSYDTHNRSNDVAASAHEFWKRTAGIWDLPNSLRLHIVIQHVNLRFWKRYKDHLGLPLFSEVVSLRPELQGLRALTGLRCRTCSGIHRSSTLRYSARDDSCYSLLELLHHFQQAHMDFDASSFGAGALGQPAQLAIDNRGPDWKQDMVWLPSDAAIRALVDSSGMDQDKLQIIAEALPDHFPHPLPQIGPTARHPNAMTRHLPLGQNPPYRDHSRIATGPGSVRGSAAGSLVARSEGSGHALEDEYDPRHPAPQLRDDRNLPYYSTRDGARYRRMGYVYTHPSGRGPDYQREVEHGSTSEGQVLERPYSHDSMVYSYEDESSKWSYRERLPRDSETTVGGFSDVRPGSKSQSHRSLPLPAVSDGRMAAIDGETTAGNETASAEAVDFLNNFNPMETNGESRTEGGSNVLAAEPQALLTPRSQSIIGRLRKSQTPERPCPHLHDNLPLSPLRPTPAMPIMASGRPPRAGGEYAVRRDYISIGPHEAPFDVSRRQPGGGYRYTEELPERLHRVRQYGDDEATREDIYPQYQRRYYLEEPYTGGGRRYETARQVMVEGNPLWTENMPDRYIEISQAGPTRYVDDGRYHLARNSREEPGLRGPREYRPEDEDQAFAHQTGQHYGYTDYDDHYLGGGLLQSGQRARGMPLEGREVLYEAVDQHRRHVPRTRHMDVTEE